MTIHAVPRAIPAFSPLRLAHRIWWKRLFPYLPPPFACEQPQIQEDPQTRLHRARRTPLASFSAAGPASLHTPREVGRILGSIMDLSRYTRAHTLRSIHASLPWQSSLLTPNYSLLTRQFLQTILAKECPASHPVLPKRARRLVCSRAVSPAARSILPTASAKNHVRVDLGKRDPLAHRSNNGAYMPRTWHILGVKSERARVAKDICQTMYER